MCKKYLVFFYLFLLSLVLYGQSTTKELLTEIALTLQEETRNSTIELENLNLSLSYTVQSLRVTELKLQESEESLLIAENGLDLLEKELKSLSQELGKLWIEQEQLRILSERYLKQLHFYQSISKIGIPVALGSGIIIGLLID